ncbi:MAG: RidA family protein [Rhizobiales bacterium]|nr:RidA family protein [Hyphomicrobiales bacterium]
MKHLIADDIAPPFGNYSHAVEIPPAARILSIAGQVGVHPDGRVGETAEEQTELIFANIERVLAKAGMTLKDLVKLNFFVVSRTDLPAIRAVRDRVLGTPAPALSLVLVAALGQESWRLEVDGVAARKD